MSGPAPSAQPKVSQFISDTWDNSCQKAIEEYIKIDNLSPDYDEHCLTNGKQEKAMQLAVDWVNANLPQGAKLKLYEKRGEMTPFLHIEVPAFNVPAESAPRCMIYQHFDKQPWMDGWEEGLSPIKPVIRNHEIFGGPLLYGRGGADDGYGIFATITAINDIQKRGGKHGHLDVVMEMAEESDSSDLVTWIQKLIDDKILVGIDFIITLDSGAADYMKGMYLTTSLRGVGAVRVKVDIAKEAIHSGIGGGVVPDPTRVLNLLRERIEDPTTGLIKLPSLNPPIPQSVIDGLAPFRDIPTEEFQRQFGLLPGVKPFSQDNVELMLASTWKPSVTLTGFDGCPSTALGGNVIRGTSAMKLSIRLPPTADPVAVRKELEEVLTRDPPYGAKLTVVVEEFHQGWKAPELKPWLATSVVKASSTVFGDKSTTPRVFPMGGSIPFMKNLGDLFPQAQFVITGVLGPASNAHAPNEFLHLPYAKGICGCVAMMLEDHANESQK